MGNTPLFRPNGIVTLTTDFGTSDGYVGAMKGALIRGAPGLVLHDLAHDIAPQNVLQGATILRAACPFFPEGTVHVGVIDPGVGTRRAAVVAIAGGHAFVGPDNGLFSLVAAQLNGISESRRIDPQGAIAPRLPPARARTFDGRDLFAPTAAALASAGLSPNEIGPPHKLLSLTPAPLEEEGDALVGSVTHLDRFGNAVTNVPKTALIRFADAPLTVLVAGHQLPLATTYGDVATGRPLALAGSEGLIEIAVRDGSAARELSILPGTRVKVLSRSTP